MFWKSKKNKKIELLEESIKKVNKVLEDLKTKTGVEYAAVTTPGAETQMFIPQSEKDRIDEQIRESNKGSVS